MNVVDDKGGVHVGIPPELHRFVGVLVRKGRRELQAHDGVCPPSVQRLEAELFAQVVKAEARSRAFRGESERDGQPANGSSSAHELSSAQAALRVARFRGQPFTRQAITLAARQRRIDARCVGGHWVFDADDVDAFAAR